MCIISVDALSEDQVEYLSSDADLNHELTIEDARKTLQFAINLEYYTKAHVLICDQDNDNKITINDARLILRQVIKLDPKSTKKVIVGQAEFSQWINKENTQQLYIPPQPTVEKKSGTFIFYCYGYGHGLGLSQFGAIGMEKQGSTYKEILQYYFTDVEFATAEVPQYTVYCGSYVNTQELIARMVYQEIYGITEYGATHESIKAQTICVFTLLKQANFNVTRYQAGDASSLSYSALPANLKQDCLSVSGEYLYAKGDSKKTPILTFYCAAVGGKTFLNEYVNSPYPLSYIQSVPSYYDMTRTDWQCIRTYTKTKDQVYNTLCAYLASQKRLNSDVDTTLDYNNPSSWIQILSHTASIDENRGYVTSVKLGNNVFTGNKPYMFFFATMMFYTSCVTVEYVP